MHIIRLISIQTLVLLFSIESSAQLQTSGSPFDTYKKEAQQAFNRYVESRRSEFNEYRRKRNEEFADYLKSRWEEFKPNPSIPKPKEDPVPPVIIKEGDDNDKLPLPKPKTLPFDEVISVPNPTPQPNPIDPIDEIVTPIDRVKEVGFKFFGTEEKVRFDVRDKIELKVLDEDKISLAWIKLSEDPYVNLVYDCLEIRKKRNLDDWSYLTMLSKMAESIFGVNTNESVLLTGYVFCQSGYNMRLGISDKSKLVLLFGTKHIIYDWAYFSIDNTYYYPTNKEKGQIKICKYGYPQEQNLSLTNYKLPSLSYEGTIGTNHKSRRFQDMQVCVKANKNMLDYYSSYPTSMYDNNFMTRWAMYANAPMPEYIKSQVYPLLKASIKGCDQLTAVNKILNFVQTGFAYELDDKVWGEDRAFFPEESLYYPYCDCEDRSILLTRLVRDLLGLNCILIYYPNHLASAVEFTDDVMPGDYINLNGKRFFITDGTITGVGAPVGVTMDTMDNSKAKIILLN